MPLAENLDFQPETKTIEYKGKPLGTFRGLTYNDLVVLVRDNLPAMQAAARDLAPRGDVDKILHGQSYAEIALACVTANPDLVAKIMALAADEQDKIATFKLFPFALTISVMAEVIRLTLEDVGGPLGLGLLLIKVVTGQNPDLGALMTSWLKRIERLITDPAQNLMNQSLASIEASGTA